jgi:VWFA-related protein
MTTRRAVSAALLLAAGWSLFARTAASSAADKPQLTAEERQWLEEEGLLIRKEEKKQFLALAQTYQRDEFIRKWWQARDPDPATPQNEFKTTWEARLAEVRERYGNLKEDRARAFLLHGEPAEVHETSCALFLWPIEIWLYRAGPELPEDFTVIFVQRGGGGSFRLWHPEDGFGELQALFHGVAQPMVDTDEAQFFNTLRAKCPGDGRLVEQAVQTVLAEKSFNTLDLIERPPGPRDTEWIATFRATTTDLPKGAAGLAARLDLGFPERDGGETLVQGVLAVPAAAAKVAVLAGRGTYSFLLTGEVLRDGQLLDKFRYRFDVPAEGIGAAVPIAFERKLRPGHYEMVVKLDDVNGGGIFHDRRAIEVPEVAAASAAPADPAVAAGLAAAHRELGQEPAGSAPAGVADAPSLRLLPLGHDAATGPVRIEAAAQGEAIHKVSFFLDGKALLTKARPPWSVDVNLGDLPTPHTVRAVGLDGEGREVAADELPLNAAVQRLAVRLLEPRRGVKPGARLRARAEVRVPDGRTLDRVELYLGDRRVATLFQPPFTQPLPPLGNEARFVRAVAYLQDGESAEDTVLFDTAGYSEQVDVQLVEVYAAVKDAARRPVADLAAADFRVRDGGAPQRIVRFERVADLPISAALLIDTSSSMAKSLPQARDAALALVRSLKPQDRAAVIPFNEQPRLAVKLTGDSAALSQALAGLQALGGTALYDSVVFALHYLQGVRGERAILLLTDGGDRSSRFGFDQTLEYARRAGVTVYSIGLGISRIDLLARTRMAKLASDTGGRSWFVDSTAELAGVYAEIGEDLRSRYLLAYQPTPPGKPGEFRPVTVEVDRPGAEVNALAGYYP